MTIKPTTDIYARLYASLKIAAETEKELRQQNEEGLQHNANKAALRQLNEIAGAELPNCMGKLISHLELQGAFQSLGRYVRSFADAEFVVRNLKEQILTSLDKCCDSTIIGVVNNFINCCISIHISNEKEIVQHGV